MVRKRNQCWLARWEWGQGQRLRRGWLLCDVREWCVVLITEGAACGSRLHVSQQSRAISHRSVQASLPRVCVITRVEGVGSSRTRCKYRLSWGHSLVSSIFLPISPPQSSSESCLSRIELWMTDSVSLGSNPDVFEVVLRLSYVFSIFQANSMNSTGRFLFINIPCHYYPDLHLCVLLVFIVWQ